ncbi:hypothetical protein RhiXN_08368 [Rhizoctonia solani]|uniref:Uncharacterized protein n=1 Tax=Rhizoctonia solani TaxID=456999 RepID=A0A8H8P2X2_9AGAM|nr:uncharacterized protein RhiXN_08368 [Rhizoctonia solani]QRW23332.1 hypothetical protein RhiXN_08368 [Rhizoctonia solani]
MAHVVDSRPRFNSYPTPISTNYPPSSSKAHYTYAAATPTTTPTKSHPSSSYHYRQASNHPHPPALCACEPVFVFPTGSPHIVFDSEPTQRILVGPSPDPPLQHPADLLRAILPLAQELDLPHPAPHCRCLPRSQARRRALCFSSGSAAATICRCSGPPGSVDCGEGCDTQAHGGAPAQGPGTVLVRRDPAIGREAARKQEEEQRKYDENRRRTDDKLRQAAQAQAEREREKHARSQERGHERGRSQTHNPAAPSGDKKWYNFFRDKSRDGRRKDDRGSDREQRPERERAKSEGRAREAVEARERVDKDRARNANSPSSIAVAWSTYEKACAALMDSKPKGKNLTFYDIPWPVLGQANSFHDLTNANIAAFLLSPHHSRDKSPKVRLRAAILIWHPDKFAQKVLPHVAESHRPAVLAAVNVVARIVTELISAN